jgi:hypothetical protein
MKKLQIIEIPEYYLAVSDEEIKEGDYRCNIQRGYLKKIEEDPTYFNKRNDVYKKIIAYQPKGNSPELDLPLLPKIVVEDDVERLVYGKSYKNPYRTERQEEFIEGYKTATKIYSEDDLRKAMSSIIKWVVLKNPNDFVDVNDKINETIQSLKQPKTPKWFLAEMETTTYADDAYASDGGYYTKRYSVTELKTTTINGKTYLVGTYQ